MIDKHPRALIIGIFEIETSPYMQPSWNTIILTLGMGCSTMSVETYISLPTRLNVWHCFNHDLNFCSHLISGFQKLQDAFCENYSLRAWMLLIE